MRNSVIIIDVKDNELCAYDQEDINYRQYSLVEKKALLHELLCIHYDSIELNDNNEMICMCDNDCIIFRNFQELRKLSEFSHVYEYLEKEQTRLINLKQKDKLKNKKNKLVTRVAIFGIAAILSLPCMINTSHANIEARNKSANYLDIKEGSYSLENIDTNVLQGVCTVGEYTFITAYDSSKDKNNSTVYVINKNNDCIREVTLYNNSHVGGICYDQKHEIFWITDKGGTISGYSFNSIFYSKEDIIEPVYKKVDVGSKDLINHKGNPSAAYIAYHNNKLYVGNFSTNGTGILKSFDILEDGNINIKSETIAKFLDKVQGITFYEKDGKEYLLVSSSYGKFSNSNLRVFKFDEKCEDYNDSLSIDIEMPSMMEQITFNKDGQLITLFESNAQKYKVEKNMQNNDVIITNIEEIIESHKL